LLLYTSQRDPPEGRKKYCGQDVQTKGRDKWFVNTKKYNPPLPTKFENVNLTVAHLRQLILEIDLPTGAFL